MSGTGLLSTEGLALISVALLPSCSTNLPKLLLGIPLFMHRFLLKIVAAIILTLTVAEAAHAQWVWTPQTRRFINLDRLPKETAELQVEYARSLMLEGRHRKAIRETVKFDEFYGDSEFADENQFLRGEIAKDQGNYMSAAQEFQLVRTGYPNSDLHNRVIDEQYEIAQLYYDKGVGNQDAEWYKPFKNRPFRRAIEVYTMVIGNERYGSRAPEARYRIGLCYFTREEFEEAALEYRTVIEEYPDSDWIDEASYDLAMSHYLRSLPAAYDQVPSFLTIEAIDEFEARFPTDSRNEELKPKRTEMFERIAEQRLATAQFYERRRQFQAALISYEVVAEQFSGTAAASEAETWLADNRETFTASFSTLPRRVE